MSTKISVVTISYNDVDGLTETILSGAAQDQTFEQIVIDGGSCDSSCKVLEDMDGLITEWVSEDDGGIYDAMNKGVARASGEYVLFMNAGDCFFDQHVIRRAIDFIEATGAELFHGRAYPREGALPYVYNQHLWQGMVCSHQSTFARRELLEKYPFSSEFRIAADYKFYVQCVTGGVALQTVDLDVARIDTSGISFASFKARTEERMQICRIYYPEERVYEHFRTILQQNGETLPEWARNKKAWLDGPT